MQAIEVKGRGFQRGERTADWFRAAVLVVLAIAGAIVLLATTSGLSAGHPRGAVTTEGRPYGQTQQPVHGNLAGDDANPGAAAEAPPSFGLQP